MLYFSKVKLFVIYFLIIFLSIFSIANFITIGDNFFTSKKINLGLDLQGGSYLLLEVNSEPIIDRNLQEKLLQLRKYFKKNNIKYKDLALKNKKIFFKSSKDDIEKFEKYFLDKENSLNAYYELYRSHEMSFSISNLNSVEDLVTISYTKFGIIEIKNSTLDQSLEIVRRRVDEVGTNEPTIIKRGNDRILIELPGLNDPNRIKRLLGKTANLSFRFGVVTDP